VINYEISTNVSSLARDDGSGVGSRLGRPLPHKWPPTTHAYSCRVIVNISVLTVVHLTNSLRNKVRGSKLVEIPLQVHTSTIAATKELSMLFNEIPE
jgi:hypothetical protein